MWLGYRQGWGWPDTLDSSTLRTGYDIGVKDPGVGCSGRLAGWAVGYLYVLVCAGLLRPFGR